MSLFSAAVSLYPQLQARHEELRLKHQVPPDEPHSSWPILLLDIGKGPPSAEGTGIHTGGDGYKVAETKKPLERMRGGVGHSMNAPVLTCALLTKPQVC